MNADIKMIKRDHDEYTIELSGRFVVYQWENYLKVKEEIERVINQYAI